MFFLERFDDATLFISTSLKALEGGDLPLQHSPGRYISQYLVRFIVGRGLQDEDKTTVCDVKSASENFLISFKLQERIKGGKDSLFQNFSLGEANPGPSDPITKYCICSAYERTRSPDKAVSWCSRLQASLFPVFIEFLALTDSVLLVSLSVKLLAILVIALLLPSSVFRAQDFSNSIGFLLAKSEDRQV